MPRNSFDTLGWFEIPPVFVEPMIRMLRLGNAAVDSLFYDVTAVKQALRSHGVIVDIDPDDDPQTRALPWRKTPLRTTIELTCTP